MKQLEVVEKDKIRLQKGIADFSKRATDFDSLSKSKFDLMEKNKELAGKVKELAVLHGQDPVDIEHYGSLLEETESHGTAQSAKIGPHTHHHQHHGKSAAPGESMPPQKGLAGQAQAAAGVIPGQVQQKATAAGQAQQPHGGSSAITVATSAAQVLQQKPSGGIAAAVGISHPAASSHDADLLSDSEGGESLLQKQIIHKFPGASESSVLSSSSKELISNSSSNKGMHTGDQDLGVNFSMGGDDYANPAELTLDPMQHMNSIVGKTLTHLAEAKRPSWWMQEVKSAAAGAAGGAKEAGGAAATKTAAVPVGIARAAGVKKVDTKHEDAVFVPV